jgi:hypothetical protein
MHEMGPRDTLDRRNNLDIKEDSRLEVEEITAWLAKFKEKVN